MALRLRRGTNAQRALITPAEGELIYVTDTNEIYVGDGTTVGGVRITGEVVNQITQLNDVDAALPEDGHLLIYDSPTGDWVSGELPLVDLADVNAVGITDGQVLAWDETAQAFIPANNAFSNNFVGDVVGSVFADDSTLLVDAVNNTIYADILIALDIFGGTITTNQFNSLSIKPSNAAAINTLTIESIDQQAKLNFKRTSDSNIIGSGYDSDGSGGIIWTRDGLDGNQLIGGMFGYENALAIFSNDTSNNFPESHHIIWRDGKLGVGVFFPSESLETSGNVVVNGWIQGSEILIESNNITTTSSNANLRLAAVGTGTIELDVPTQTTVGAAGAADALPASPSIYFKINVDGTDYVVPGFAVS